MLVVAGNFYWKVLDRLVGVKWRVKHIELFLKHRQKPTIRAVLNVNDRIAVMFNFLNH